MKYKTTILIKGFSFYDVKNRIYGLILESML